MAPALQVSHRWRTHDFSLEMLRSGFSSHHPRGAFSQALSAHSYLGLNLAKISAEEIALNRKGASNDAKANAAVRFAARVARERGHVDEADIAQVRLAGFTDAQIVEIVALVAENSFTNFLNEVAKTEIDFPVMRAAEAT